MFHYYIRMKLQVWEVLPQLTILPEVKLPPLLILRVEREKGAEKRLENLLHLSFNINLFAMLKKIMANLFLVPSLIII